ncbi:hypothetical protein [Chryseobacterium sediminis]|uniref:Uncharacterized protein n=1 Tax=Chryseobacterium sediminis TaxID=1679494 RepID=A0A5B2U920_9FLAO|nr:hypothetical protein [Chryseobacterium sediminis]KAA2223039.1 hypothetical protein FW780_02205 [Chryseobacterium sediminis]
MTNIDYEKHAEIFFKKIDVESANCNETNLYDSACEYIAKESDFKEKDPVEVGSLLSVLQDKGLIQFKGTIKFPNQSGILKYLVTEKGEHYITDNRKHP